MQRFTYDILHDVTEDTEIIQSQETVRSIQLPAYATDQQRRELFVEIVEALDEVSFTAQRLRLDVGKDFVTLRRELGGGWIHQEDDDDAFQVTQSMTGVMNELNTAINEELDDIRKKQDEID
ncbi:hypothetical protein N9N21_04135 [Alphaproteobacteria bacterium]|nr:hypothetical protein [Alphaproteobacteria bacterium]